MALFLNFITALAWLCGIRCLIGALAMLVDCICNVTGSRRESMSALLDYSTWGVLAWAWLIARYAL